jgi:hypothetical protein
VKWRRVSISNLVSCIFLCFFVNFRLLGRLSGVDVNFRFSLSVVVVGSLSSVDGCRV